VNLGLGPDERLGILVIGFNESIDVLPELLDGRNGCAMQGLSFQDGEPDLHLVEPRSSRRCEVKVHIRMTIQPAIVLGLVGVEVVEDHMDCGVRVVSDDMVHEIEEFDTPSAIFVGGGHLAGSHLEGRKQRRGAIALVVMTMTGQSPASSTPKQDDRRVRSYPRG
jgi:hypothetical protein